MKKIKKISVVLALLAFTLLYGTSLAFAANPPSVPSPFGNDGPPSLQEPSNDDGPPSLDPPTNQSNSNGTQQDSNSNPVNNGSPGNTNNNQSSGDQGAPLISSDRSSQNSALDNAVADAQDSQDATGRGAADSGNEPDNLTGTGPELIYLILPTLGLSASYFLYKNKR